MTTDPLWTDLSNIAVELARRAGESSVAMRTEAVGNFTTKSSNTDIVTAADTATEKLITTDLNRMRPDDGVLGEEGAAISGSSGVIWHVDPIDGTTNYLYGIPQFSVSIAAEADGQVVAGAVFNPVADEMYAATKGAGATLNGEGISCNTESDLAKALVGTGFGYKGPMRRHQVLVLAEFIADIRDIRRFGSAALDLCALAAGRVDAYYEQGLNPWDLAAGTLIATEAGARVENLAGGPPDKTFALGVTTSLFEQFKSRLIAAGAGQLA